MKHLEILPTKPPMKVILERLLGRQAHHEAVRGWSPVSHKKVAEAMTGALPSAECLPLMTLYPVPAVELSKSVTSSALPPPPEFSVFSLRTAQPCLLSNGGPLRGRPPSMPAQVDQ